MKRLLLIVAWFIIITPAVSQKKKKGKQLTQSQQDSIALLQRVGDVEKMVTRQDVEGPLTFLAADEMRGRDTGSREIEIAANYISAQFQQLGLQALPGAERYFQKVDLERSFSATSGELKLGSESFLFKDQFVVRDGENREWQGEFIYVGYGSAAELPANISGKMVVALVGTKDMTNPMQMLSATREKLSQIRKSGAAGLIEIITTLPFPWPALADRYNRTRIRIKPEGEAFTSVLIKDTQSAAIKELKEKGTLQGSLKIGGVKRIPCPSKNVVGKIEGTDPVLKNEHLVISAHYDHVGVGAKKDQDSIYNGARDNALGTVGMMTAARFLTKYPPKRSVIFIALTAEEKGLLGSDWYVEHPLVPLRQTVFDFDCDGAGYNDKTVATVIGLERTSAEANISKACEAFGLKAGRDPVPEQNLYERSDNYNFAKKGVPAIDFSTGVKSFDAEIQKYYHQPADEVATLDFDYLVKYYRAFVLANDLLANDPKTPTWNAGDKFEPVGKSLYQK